MNQNSFRPERLSSIPKIREIDIKVRKLNFFTATISSGF